MNLLSFFCQITGTDYQILKEDTQLSKNKVRLMGSVIFIPVSLWFLNGFLLARHTFSLNIILALSMAFVVGLLIFIIEQAVILAKGGKWIVRFRVTLGLIVALLGATIMDEQLFKQDIQRQLAEDYQNKEQVLQKTIDNHYQAQIQALTIDIQQKEEIWQKASQAYLAEADGTGGSKSKGCGKICQEKKKRAESCYANYKMAQKALTQLQEEKKQQFSQQKELLQNQTAGFLTNIKALHQIIKNDNWALLIYFLIFGFFFSLEFLVIIFKLTCDETNYERKIKMIEKIGQQRMQKILEKQPHLFDPSINKTQYETTEKLLNQPTQSLFN